MNNDKDWSQTTISDLVDHLISTHHVYVKENLPRLMDLMTRVVGLHGSHFLEVHQLDQLVRGIVADLGPHLMKEEHILFPAMKNLENSLENSTCGSVQNPIRVMESDHDHIDHLFDEIRKLTHDYTLPNAACETWKGLYKALQEFEADTQTHIQKENDFLFPMAIELEQGERG